MIPLEALEQIAELDEAWVVTDNVRGTHLVKLAREAIPQARLQQAELENLRTKVAGLEGNYAALWAQSRADAEELAEAKQQVESLSKLCRQLEDEAERYGQRFVNQAEALEQTQVKLAAALVVAETQAEELARQAAVIEAAKVVSEDFVVRGDKRVTPIYLVALKEHLDALSSHEGGEG